MEDAGHSISNGPYDQEHWEMLGNFYESVLEVSCESE